MATTLAKIPKSPAMGLTVFPHFKLRESKCFLDATRRIEREWFY
jgi:hypothetical protein